MKILRTELEGDDLSEDCTELSGRSGDTVSSRSVAGREDFSGNDEGSGVGSEVLHEVGHLQCVSVSVRTSRVQ